MSQKRKKLKTVAVRWVDSTAHGGWHKDGTAVAAADCISLGFVVLDTPQVIALAQSVAANTVEAGNLMVIPKCCIQSIERIEA